MATRTAGRASSAPPTLDTATVGQMIGRLRTLYSYKGCSYWRRMEDRKEVFSDEEIMTALGLTKEQFDHCLNAWKMRPPRQWDSQTARKAFFAFVRKYKRWPSETDYRNWRETGLPARSSLQICCRGEWSLIEAYASSHTLTPELVLSIPNITVRRNVIARYGIEKLIRNGGGEKIQQDDFGSLWRLPSDGVDPYMQYVEVVNKTPQMNEKTGKYVTDKKGDYIFDHYFLRVPPDVATARAAVAWTFSIEPSKFRGFALES